MISSTTRQPIEASLISFPEQISVSLDQNFKPARKKRLTLDQTKALEHYFAFDSRLEPQMKNKLACELGLDPRQIAIWYQNRRARTKTKNLEDKYVAMHRQYQEVLEENKKLEAEVFRLREMLGLEEKVKLVAEGTKAFAKNEQEDNSFSALSTNRKEPALPVMKRRQQQIDKRSKTKEKSVDSKVGSSASMQSKASHDAMSTAGDCKHNQSSNVLNQVCETAACMPLQEEEICHLNHQLLAHMSNDHQHLYQQPQHHEHLQHLQHHYQFSCVGNLADDVKLESYAEYPMIPSTLHHFENHLIDDYRFDPEDGPASLYFELATQA